MMRSLFAVWRALRPTSPRLPTALAAAHEKTKGPRAATRIAAPWRQGTETGSDIIVFAADSNVNSQRQLGKSQKEH